MLRPASKLSAISWWDDVTLGADLGVARASTDDVYAAMDWLVARQDDIEKQLARRHLREGGIAMFGLSSSWVEGSSCELAARGYSRDGKRGKAQIEYGLLTDPDGWPVAVRVFAGNTGDPKTFPEAVDAVRGTFGLQQMIMVRDRSRGPRSGNDREVDAELAAVAVLHGLGGDQHEHHRVPAHPGRTRRPAAANRPEVPANHHRQHDQQQHGADDVHPVDRHGGVR